MPNQKLIQKRSFLLFEVLIGLALFACALMPLIRALGSIRETKWQAIEEMALQKLAREAFCELKIMLYEDKLPNSASFLGPISGEFEGLAQITLPKGSSKREIKTFQRKFLIRPIEKFKIAPNGNRYLILEAEIELKSRNGKPKTYYYPLFIIQHERV